MCVKHCSVFLSNLEKCIFIRNNFKLLTVNKYCVFAMKCNLSHQFVSSECLKNYFQITTVQYCKIVVLVSIEILISFIVAKRK